MVAEGQTNRNQPHAARPLAAGGPATHRGCSDSSLCHGGRVVSVDWGDWSSFEGSPGRELGGLKPAAARRYFDALMAARPARRVALERLLERNHAPISIADDGLQRLNDWYGENVSGADGRLVARWYAVGLDVALYIADAMIARAPGLEWRMYTMRRQALSYQRPVLMGFTRVRDPDYHIDPELVVTVHGHRLVTGLEEDRDLFVRMVRSGAEKA